MSALAVALALALAAPGLADGAETGTKTASAALEAQFAEDDGALSSYEGPGFGRAFVEMLVALALVSLLAYLVVGRVLPRLLRVPTPAAAGRLLSVVDRLPIDPRRSLLVVRLGEQHYLVGSAEQGLTMLTRLDAGDVRDALAAARIEAAPAAWPSMARWFGRLGLAGRGEPATPARSPEETR